MISVRQTLQSSTALTSASLALLLLASVASANPLDGQVVAGDATITTPDPSTLVINQQSQNVVLEWGSFNIDAGETTTFVQPNVDAWALNRVVGSQDPSVIAGTLNANGNIAIVNPDGIIFSHGSRVDVGGLVATTADIDNDAFMRGNLSFNLPGNPAASVINEGTVSIRDHGLAAFVAPGVRNSGVITARLGTVSLTSGNTFSLDLYGDGLVSLAIGDEITEEVIDVATGQPMADMVKNEGTISANGGTVALTAATARTAVNSVINNTGVIEANSVGMLNGRIILGAQTTASRPATAPTQTVRVSGQIRATAVTTSLRPAARPGSIQITGEDIQIAGATIDASGTNGGGTVLIGGDYLGGQAINDMFPLGEEIREDYDVATAATVAVDNATTIDASATVNGDGGKIILWSDEATTTSADILATGAGDGTGGFIETSSAGTLSLPEGYVTAGAGGMWLLDPRYLYVSTSAAVIGDTEYVNSSTIADSLNAGTNVRLEATGENAELAVYSDILKTSGGDAQLLLGSTGSVLIDADIISTSGNLDVGIATADIYDDTDSNGFLLAVPSGRFQLNGGNTINTNGGQFGFRGVQFQAIGATEFILGEDPTIVPPGRIVTEGGNITFQFTPISASNSDFFAGYFGCDGSSTDCGLGSNFVLDAGSGRVAFGLNPAYTLGGAANLPQIFVGDQGIRTTGELVISDVTLKSDRATNRNGIHNVEFGTLSVLNDAVIDFPFADVPGLESYFAATPVAGVSLPTGNYVVGERIIISLPTLFTPGLSPIVGISVSGPDGGHYEIVGDQLLIIYNGEPGTLTLTITATTVLGQKTDITLSIDVTAPIAPPPVDTPPIAFPGTVSLPNAEVGTAYNQTTQVLFSDDQAVSGLTLIIGGLPAGLTATANNDGTVTISGTPTTSGAVAFSVTATDAGGNIAAINVNLTIGAAPPPPPVDNPPTNTGNATTLVNAVAGTAYSATTTVLFSDENGVGGLSLTVSGLPAGLSAVDNGNGTVTISGTPATSGAINFTVTAADGAGQTTATTVALTVNNPVIETPVDNPPTVVGSNTTLPNATVGTSYLVTTPVLFTDDNGVSGLTLIVTGLPAGLAATDNGDGTVTITGNPSLAGAVSFTVTATDAGGNSINTHGSFTVNDPTVTPPDPTDTLPTILDTGIESISVLDTIATVGESFFYVSPEPIVSDPDGVDTLSVFPVGDAPDGFDYLLAPDGRLIIRSTTVPPRGILRAINPVYEFRIGVADSALNSSVVSLSPITLTVSNSGNSDVEASVENPTALIDGADSNRSSKIDNISDAIAAGQRLTTQEAVELSVQLISAYESDTPYLDEGLDFALRTAYQGLTGVAVPSAPSVVKLFGIGVAANAFGEIIMLDLIKSMEREIGIAVEFAGTDGGKVGYQEVYDIYVSNNSKLMADALDVVGTLGLGIGDNDLRQIIDQTIDDVIIARIIRFNASR